MYVYIRVCNSATCLYIMVVCFPAQHYMFIFDAYLKVIDVYSCRVFNGDTCLFVTNC